MILTFQIHDCCQVPEEQKAGTKLLFNSQHMITVKNKMVEFEVALKVIDEVSGHIGNQGKATEDNIRATFKELKFILERRQDLLLKQVGELTTEKLSLVNGQKSKIIEANDRVSNYAIFLDQSIENKTIGLLSDFTSAYWSKQSENYGVLQMEPCEQANLQFYCDNNLVSMLRNTGSVAVSSVSPSHCVAEGNGISSATVGQDTDFTTLLMTADSKPCCDQIHDVKAFVKQCSDDTIVSAKIVKREKNIIFFSYRPLITGKHLLHIQVFGKEISGSPYIIKVQQPFTFEGDCVHEFSCIDMQLPLGITCTASRHVVVVDNTGWKGVVVFDYFGKLVNRFMDAMSAINVWGPEGMCYYPTGITVDGEGNILVVDGGMNRIQKFTEDGTLLKVVGSAGDKMLQFKSPVGIRVNNSDEVYICDQKNNRIQVLDSNLSFLRMFGCNGPNNDLVFPWDVAFDSTQNVYVADVGSHHIQVFSPDGTFLRKFGCEGDGRFVHLSSICIDQKDHVYAADKKKHCIKVFNTEGEALMVIDGMFNEPLGVAVSNDGLLYVADSCNKRILVFR